MPYHVIPAMAADLKALGVARGDLVIFHSSFKALGLTDATPGDCIATLVDAVGPEGTLMAPTFTYSYAGVWNVKPFHPDKTPGVANGVLTETLRQYPLALRSAHPTYSVAAIGPQARGITENKERASGLGRGSSFEVAIKLGAKILLLGVGNNRNSALHYAEVLAGLPYHDIGYRSFWGKTALVEKDGVAVEVALPNEFPACSGNFGVADDYLRDKRILKSGSVLAADSMLMDAQRMVDATVERLRREPAWLLCDNFACEPCTLRKRRLREKGMI